MRSVRYLLIALVIYQSHLLAEEIEVKIRAASQDIAVGSPLSVRVIAKNVDFEKVVLNSALLPANGTLLFQVRGPDEKEFREIPGDRHCELGIGPKTEWQRNEIHEAATLLIPATDDPFFDSTGLWSLRAQVASGKVKGTSEAIRIFVRAASNDEVRESLRLNGKLAEAILAGHKTAPKFYERIIASPAAGREMQKVANWHLAIARLMESESIEKDYKSAVDIQSALDECNKVLFAQSLAEALFALEKDELAREQLAKLDGDSRQRIEYAIKEKRRGDKVDGSRLQRE